jgi:hypothetical protein
VFLAAASGLPPLDLPRIVLAIGALGTAAYGVVDVTKAFGGGISNRGFGDIKNVISPFFPVIPPVASPAASVQKAASALSLASVLSTLRANWLNGMALADQKSVAKALIKLNLSPASASAMAAATGVDGTVLSSIAAKLPTGAALAPAEGAALTLPETDAYGRFDLLLSAALDHGYQRGDQRYRNSAKLLAVPVAVLLAVLGTWAISNPLTCSDIWRAIAGGLLATPLAPMAKDLASAIQAGSKLAQAWTK